MTPHAERVAREHRVNGSRWECVVRLFVWGAIVLCILAVCNGCEAYSKEDAQADRDALVAGIAEIDAEIAKLPEGDPVREKYEAHRAKLQQAVRVADAVIAEDPAKLSEAVQGIPYAGLAVAVGGLLWTLVKRAKERQANRELVRSVESLVPVRTDEQKLMLAGVQSGDTKKIVSDIKAGK